MAFEKQQKNGGKLPYGAMDEILSHLGCESLNRDKVNYELKRMKRVDLAASTEDSLASPPVAVVDDASIANVSQLTSPSMSVGTGTNSTNRKLGRPKKTLEDSFGEKDVYDREQKCIKAASERYRAVKESKKRLANGTLHDIIKKAKKDFNIPESTYICPSTIRMRVQNEWSQLCKMVCHSAFWYSYTLISHRPALGLYCLVLLSCLHLPASRYSAKFRKITFWPPPTRNGT